jgi:hypothetical protein
VYSGPITYNLNHSSLLRAAPPWMMNPLLTYIGVSDYLSLVSTPQTLSADDMRVIWQNTVLPLFNSLSSQTGKRVLLSEIGFRNATDALINPFKATTPAPADPQLQADAYTAALDTSIADANIAGPYFWGWNQGRLMPTPQAQAVIVQFCSSHACF